MFNLVNTRKINDEKNIFAGIQNNPIFMILWLFIIALQVLIIIFGGRAIEVSLEPLPW
jgi:Ca2+-transporting ATPase